MFIQFFFYHFPSSSLFLLHYLLLFLFYFFFSFYPFSSLILFSLSFSHYLFFSFTYFLRSFFNPPLLHLISVPPLLYFFPCLYLYNFSSKMQTAIRHNDQISLNKSFQSLKSLLKFWGILTIIMLCIWVLAIIFGVALGTMFSAH